MIVTVDVDLTADELTRIAAIAGVPFLSADDLAIQLQQLVRRSLAPGVDLGYLYRVTYYREDADEHHGYRMYQHTFMGPGWPHVPGRPRMTWDGIGLRTTGGAHTVCARRGIIDREKHSE